MKKKFFHAWTETAMIIKMGVLDIDSHSCVDVGQVTCV